MPVPSRRPASRVRRAALVSGGAAILVGAAASAVIVVLSPSGQAPGRAPSRPSGGGRVPVRTVQPLSTAGWRAARVDGTIVPVSPHDGPARRGGGAASGYADTRGGAVLAAVNITVRASGDTGPATWKPAIGEQVTGPWQPDLLKAAEEESSADKGKSVPLAVEVTSFRLAAWTAGSATVDLAVSSVPAQSRCLQVQVGVQWQNGDWRLVAPPGGEFTPTRVLPGADPAGFTALPGTGGTR